MSGRPRSICLLAAALSLTACESNLERSAKLEQARLAHNAALKTSTLSILRPNPQVQVIASAILTGREGDAVAITLRNRGSRAMSAVPIEIAVKSASGQVLYRNNSPGVAGSLVAVPLLPPRTAVAWVDDQVSVAGRAASVSVLVGEGSSAPGAPSRLRIEGVHAIEGGEGVAGAVVNGSATAQRELVVDALAHRAGRIVAAGRAVLPEVGAHASSAFQLYLIGDARGARLDVTAAASSAG